MNTAIALPQLALRAYQQGRKIPHQVLNRLCGKLMNNSIPLFVGDSESATPAQSPDLTNEKWYKKNAVESEEAEEAIPVRRTMDGRHVEAGDERDVYMVPQTKRK